MSKRLNGEKEMDIEKIADDLANKIAAKKSFEVIVDHVSMEVTEDSYEKGELGRHISVGSRSNFGNFKSVDLAIKAVSDYSGLPFQNFFIFDGENGRIDGNGLVDDDNSYVGNDARFIKSWKAGEVTGWDMQVTMHIRFAAVWEPTDDEISKRTRIKKD